MLYVRRVEAGAVRISLRNGICVRLEMPARRQFQRLHHPMPRLRSEGGRAMSDEIRDAMRCDLGHIHCPYCAGIYHDPVLCELGHPDCDGKGLRQCKDCGRVWRLLKPAPAPEATGVKGEG